MEILKCTIEETHCHDVNTIDQKCIPFIEDCENHWATCVEAGRYGCHGDCACQDFEG